MDSEKSGKEDTNTSGKKANYYKWLLILIITANVVMVTNLGVNYKIQPLLDEIAQLKAGIAQKPTIKVINTRELVNHFSMSGYDTVTQLEYMDILKILLDKSRIVAINEDSLLFKSPSNELKINDIDTLRSSLKQLNIENPRVANEEQYKQREQQQKELLERLTSGNVGQ